MNYLSIYLEYIIYTHKFIYKFDCLFVILIRTACIKIRDDPFNLKFSPVALLECELWAQVMSIAFNLLLATDFLHTETCSLCQW